MPEATTPSVNELLDPEWLVAAAPGHGVFASRRDPTTTFITVSKVVEVGARALVLYLPGVIRVDVSAYQDSLRVGVRRLIDQGGLFGTDHTGQKGWRSQDTHTPSMDERLPMRFYVQVGDSGVLLDLLISADFEPEVRTCTLCVRTMVQERAPDTVRTE